MSTSAANIYGKDWQAGQTYHEWNLLDSDGVNLIAGNGYSNSNWVTAIRFEIGSYAQSVTFSWRTGSRFGGGTGVMKYKLTNAEDSSLVNADYNTAADGTFTAKLSELTSNKLTVTRTLAPGTYYLYIWQGAAAASFTSIYFFTGSYGMTVNYEAVAGTASTVALSGNVLGSPVSIQITRDNADFVHTLTWSFAGKSGTIAARTADTLVKWTPNADTFGAYIPTASSGTLTVSCTTYYGTQQIGAVQKAAITMYIPSDAAPTLSDGWAAVSHSNTGTAAAGLSACIAGYSKAAVTFNSAKVKAKYGATVKTLSAKMGGVTLSGSGTIGTVATGANTVTLTATDSRGKSTSQTVTLTALSYSKPVLGGVTVFRCNKAGAEDDSGAYYSAKATVTYSDAGGEISCTITAALKPVGGSYGTAVTLTAGKASVLGGSLSATVTYIVRIQAKDTLGSSTAVEVAIPTAAVAFHIPDGGDGLGLGKYNEAGGFVDSAWPLKMNGNKITGLGTPTADSDAVPWSMVGGFGLGSAYVHIRDFNTAVNNGWYYGTAETANAPAGFTSNCAVFVVHRTASQIYQYLFYPANGCVMQRYTADGGASWTNEWINPPMALGVEYRTTKRHNGKAVYAKAVDFGALPNASSKSLAVSVPNRELIVSVRGVTSAGRPIPYTTDNSTWGSIGVFAQPTGSASTNVGVSITTTSDQSSNTATIILEYTKS